MATQTPSTTRAKRPPLPQDSLWLNSLLRPALITLLVGCINVAFVAFMAQAWPAMPATLTWLLLVLAGVGGIVGGYSATLLFQPEQRSRRFWGYRLAEFGLLLFVTRLIMWGVVDGWPDWQLMLYQPADALFSLSFVLALFVTLIAWGVSSSMTQQFLEMGLKPDELMERGSGLYNPFALDSRMGSDRQAMLNSFIGQWIGGGIFLLLLTAGSRVESVAQRGQPFLALSRQPVDGLVIGASVFYFLLGLVLVGIGRLAVLRARWQIEGIPGGERVIARWPLYTLILLAGVGGVALLLPMGSTFWLGRILAGLITGIYLVIYALFSLFMGLLGALFPAGEIEEPEEMTIPLEMPPPEAMPSGTVFELPAWIGGAFFWLVIVLILGYGAYIYFSGKGFSLAWVGQWWQALKERWRAFWASLRRVTPLYVEEGEAQGSQSLAWLREHLRRIQLGRLSPTQRVRYYYLRMLSEAGERGVPRRASETPFRYAPRLEAEMIQSRAEEENGSQSQEEIDSVERLTAEFVEIHYGNHQVTPEEVPLIQQIWQRIHDALRRGIKDA
jgi:hypothetical protein